MNTLVERDEKEFVERMKEKRLIAVEILLWAFGAIIAILPLVINLIYRGERVSEYFGNIILTILLLLFPNIYRLIFGQLPLQNVRTYFQKIRKFRKKAGISGSDAIVDVDEENKIIHIPEIDEYLYTLTVESKSLSEKIYSRAGVYLLVGILLAISGVMYFSYNRVDYGSSIQIEMLILLYLPKFGSLIFIEFVAFFFLKQYRINMDEFKYYESIKRQRESQLATMIIYGAKDDVDLQAVLKSLSFFSNPDKLKSGETTITTEARKFSNQELEIFKSIIDNFKMQDKN